MNLQEMEKRWREARPIMKNTIPELFQLLRDEVDEAELEIEMPENMGGELADIILFTYTIANQYGINMEFEVEKKIIRNHLKYVAAELQDGDYQEKRKLLREAWKD